MTHDLPALLRALDKHPAWILHRISARTYYGELKFVGIPPELKAVLLKGRLYRCRIGRAGYCYGDGPTAAVRAAILEAQTEKK